MADYELDYIECADDELENDRHEAAKVYALMAIGRELREIKELLAVGDAGDAHQAIKRAMQRVVQDIPE